MADKVDWLGLCETSAGSFRLTIQKENGYDDTYWFEEEELKYLFNKSGKVLREKD